MNLIMKAAELARKAHEGQKRKYNGTPYVRHPARVAARTALLPDATEEMVAAAFTHDVIEDTSVTLEELIAQLGAVTGSLVDWMTNKSKITNPQANREERKRIDRERLGNAPREAKLIKLIDRIDNLSEMDGSAGSFVALYVKESLLLAETIGDADPGLKKELIDTANALSHRHLKGETQV